MGSRYNAADRSTGGYQSRQPEPEDREEERQTVLGAFTEAVGSEGAEDGSGQEHTTGGHAAGDTAEQQEKSPNWPGSDDSDRTTETEDSSDEQEPGKSPNWPGTRESLSKSEARGRAKEANAVIDTVRNRISTPRSMSAAAHRRVVNLLEQANERGAPLAAVAGEGFDDEVHGWLTVVSGHEDLTQKTKRRAKEVVDLLFF